MKKVLEILLILFSLIFVSCALNNMGIESLSSIDKEEFIKNHSEKLLIKDVDVIKQEVSCGYAVIEMFSDWSGGERITEEALYEEYGNVVTSTGKKFEKEMNKRFPNFCTVMHKNLSCEALLDLSYKSLQKGIPVPFEWAAKFGEEWTLHYSLMVGMDLENDVITVLNPYGYVEEVGVLEFISRTSYEAYENMPFFFKMAFAFGVFERNTIFIVSLR